MRINPTFGASNKVVMFAWIPRDQFFYCVISGLLAFWAFSLIKVAAVAFGLSWLGFFAAALHDPKYVMLLWRSLRRRPVSCAILATRDARGRIVNV